ncbi:hypothetical protein Deipr_2382 (plasmid) [Deinococcus proteolyticus MRP]|uniref:Uncharacterized protein n=1 Tax=Deinococcus proteolyticus (strain ATCC 35074 / DSM 20540 / JCM 6276 / NBRC 101906 / NCIMB 13154 / VKM Ac-1939 / CCM 2703 / MRP) TaxID=693977 RepID=F0RQE7_DEIPM|nr:hypothetical protein [Deinococcus proteolyticus]ADY27506.1 hypothetical protein Deipr_2382 [Deinococcus proteolyticus MRP]
MPDTARRLQQLLKHYGTIYPQAWKQAETLHRTRQGEWPDYCYLPMTLTHSTVLGTYRQAARQPGFQTGLPEHALQLVMAQDTAVLSALTAWRLGQGIYRFDPELLRELWETPAEGSIPAELLTRLPEYCLYIEAPPEASVYGKPLIGFFAHLEYDLQDRHPELRLLLDTGETALLSYPVHLGGTLADNFVHMVSAAGMAQPPGGLANTAEQMAQLLAPMVSCLLYLCSETAEYRTQPPSRPSGKKMYRPVDGPKVWNVGERMGAALRQARAAADTGPSTGTAGSTGSHASPRGHLRRAHWHTFLRGPRNGQQERVLRWLPPIPVRLDLDSEQPAVIHRVKP